MKVTTPNGASAPDDTQQKNTVDANLKAAYVKRKKPGDLKIDEFTEKRGKMIPALSPFR